MDLQECRTKIDGIDRELVRLFAERMHTVLDVAEYKRENHMPILDAARERALLSKVTSLSGEELETYTRVLFSTILNLSRSYQAQQLFPETDLTKRLAAAVEETPRVFPEKAVVACQGVEGAYSQVACEKIFSVPDIVFVNSFDAVFRAVDAGLCRYGILPLENNTAGSVNQVYELMSKYSFYITRATRVRVSHSLLALPGATADGIREVYSHEQAIGQCSRFFAEHKNIRAVPCANTAAAAKAVADAGRLDIAALASASCASLYGLRELSSDVQDNGGNYTRFICISKKLEVYPGSDKTSIRLTLPNRPGALYHALARVAALGINLTKLESRPIPGRDFAFQFFLDFDASVYTPALTALLRELENECETFEYLGSYTEII